MKTFKGSELNSNLSKEKSRKSLVNPYKYFLETMQLNCLAI